MQGSENMLSILLAACAVAEDVGWNGDFVHRSDEALCDGADDDGDGIVDEGCTACDMMVTRPKGFWRDHPCLLDGTGTGLTFLPLTVGSSVTLSTPTAVHVYLSLSTAGDLDLALGQQIATARLNLTAFDLADAPLSDWNGDGVPERFEDLIDTADLVFDGGPTRVKAALVRALSDANMVGASLDLWFDSACVADPELCNLVDDDGDGAVDEACTCRFGAASLSVGATASAKVLGPSAGDRAGHAVAVIGDHDGDGYEDFAVAAPDSDEGAVNSGAVYVVNGPVAAGTWNLAASADTHLYKGDWDVDDVELGYEMQPAGDVNLDGFPDLLVASPWLEAYSGGFFAVLGPIPPGGVDLDLTSDPLFLGGAVFYGCGAVAGNADFTGDGVVDAVSGCFWAGSDYRGLAFVVEGPFLSRNLSRLVTLDPDGMGSNFGLYVESLGDVTGDGIDDLGVSAEVSSAGTLYVFDGPLTSYRGASAALVRLDGAAASDLFGERMAGGRDVTGDGIEDMVVGAVGNDDADTAAGAVYLFAGPVDASTTLGDAVAVFVGDAYDSLGSSVDLPGDVDGDGIDDIVVGGVFTGTSIGTGGVAVFTGPFSGTVPAGSAARIVMGDVGGEGFGTFSDRVAVGDLDASGTPDLLIGAPEHDGFVTDGGAAWVVPDAGF